jgi:phosphoglycerate dehydrogenase-like enzyme
MQAMVPDYLVTDILPKMRQSDPTVELIPVSVTGSYTGTLDKVEVIFKFFPTDRFSQREFGGEVLRGMIKASPMLRWIHNGKAGVENMLIPELVESDIVLTNGAGAPTRAVAETVLGFILADAKALPAHFRNQQTREWKKLSHFSLRGQTVVILGLGRIGLEVARLCRGFGMRVFGTKRLMPSQPIPDVDKVFPTEHQKECISQADYIVVASALTPETQGMVDRSVFECMPAHAVFINIARGEIVDEMALLNVLRSRSIRTAYLDVFNTEPLPPESPFFDLPNVVIMPHNSPHSQYLVEEMIFIFLDNFRRYCSGQPLTNLVNKRLGY